MIRDARPADQRHACRQVLLRSGQGFASRIHRFSSMRDFLGGNRAAAGQIPAALQIRLRLAQVCTPLCRDGFKLPTVGKHGANLPDRSRELLLRLVQGDFRIRAVEPHELLAGPHIVGLVGDDGDDGAAHLRHDIDQVTGHIRIIRLLVVPGIEPPISRCAQPHHGARRSEQNEPSAPTLLHHLRVNIGHGFTSTPTAGHSRRRAPGPGLW